MFRFQFIRGLNNLILLYFRKLKHSSRNSNPYSSALHGNTLDKTLKIFIKHPLQVERRVFRSAQHLFTCLITGMYSSSQQRPPFSQNFRLEIPETFSCQIERLSSFFFFRFFGSFQTCNLTGRSKNLPGGAIMAHGDNKIELIILCKWKSNFRSDR